MSNPTHAPAPVTGTTPVPAAAANPNQNAAATPAGANANNNVAPNSTNLQNSSGPTNATGPIPSISPALNPNTGPIPEPVELNAQTLPAIRNLIKHKYRGDAKAMFLKYTGEDEKNNMPLADLKSMLSDSGLPKDLVDDQAAKLIKNYDGDKDEKINIDEFDRLYSGN